MTGAELVPIVVPIVVALIAGGALTRFVSWVGAKRKARTPEGKQAASLATVDQNIAVVARARDELQEDNARLRAQLAESDARHAADRAEWAAEKTAMRAEIASLETRLRDMLTEIQNLKLRHA